MFKGLNLLGWSRVFRCKLRLAIRSDWILRDSALARTPPDPYIARSLYCHTRGCRIFYHAVPYHLQSYLNFSILKHVGAQKFTGLNGTWTLVFSALIHSSHQATNADILNWFSSQNLLKNCSDEDLPIHGLHLYTVFPFFHDEPLNFLKFENKRAMEK